MPKDPPGRRQRSEKLPHHRRLPPLHMIRAFDAVAHRGTMRRAADDVGISHTVISRRIRDLEAWLGVRLVTTGPRGARLTRQGEVYFKAVSRAFDLLSAATAELKPLVRRRTLRIWCMPGLATGWLTPRLAMVQNALPEADLVLRASARAPDFAAEEADVMIGFHERGDVPDGAVALMQPRMLPVASPGWVRDHGLPPSLAALARQTLVHEESQQQWRDWFEAAGVRIGHALRGPHLSDANLGLDAALAGVGVALVPPFMAMEEIARGRLVELFKTNVVLGRYYLLRSPALRKDALAQRFQDWLVAELQASERV